MLWYIFDFQKVLDIVWGIAFYLIKLYFYGIRVYLSIPKLRQSYRCFMVYVYTYPFLNFVSRTVEVWEWISNFTHTVLLITYYPHCIILCWCRHRRLEPLFTKQADVLRQDLAKSRSSKIQVYTFPIALKLDRHPGSSVAECQALERYDTDELYGIVCYIGTQFYFHADHSTLDTSHVPPYDKDVMG